jgi:hypothetical protein
MLILVCLFGSVGLICHSPGLGIRTHRLIIVPSHYAQALMELTELSVKLIVLYFMTEQGLTMSLNGTLNLPLALECQIQYLSAKQRIQNISQGQKISISRRCGKLERCLVND